MKIQEIDKGSLDSYSKFALKHGGVFSQLNWLSIYGNDLKIMGIYNNDRTLIGSFCLYYSEIFFSSHIKNPPYSPFIALIINNSTKNKSNSLSFEKSVIALIAEFINKLSFTILTIAFPPEFKDMQPFIWNGYKVIPNYTYKYDIQSASIDELMECMSPERRNDIRKAQKDEIEIKLTTNYKEVKEIIIKTFFRKEKKINYILLEKILCGFANKNNSFAFVAYKKNQPIACSFCIYDKQTAYYLLGGYDELHKHQGAGANAVWNAVLHAKKIGLSYFDFEGSMIQPVEKFFRGFGASLVPYFTVNKASLPIEVGLKFIKRGQF